MAEVKTLPEKLVDEIAVSIDGQQFFVRNPDAISALDHMYIQRSMHRFGILLEQEDNTEDEQAEVTRRLDRICRTVVNAPIEELAKLNDQQRLKIVDFFVPRLLDPAKKKAQATASQDEKSTGTNQSPN